MWTVGHYGFRIYLLFFVHDEMLASVITFRINPGLLFFYIFYGEHSSIL